MFSTIKRIYKKTNNPMYVVKAYWKGWITEEEVHKILGADYVIPEKEGEKNGKK